MNFKNFFKTGKLKIIKVLVLTLISIGFISILPWLSKLLIDNIGSLDKGKVISYGLAYVGSIVFFLIFEYLKKLSINDLKKTFNLESREALYERIGEIEPYLMDQKESGHILSALTNDLRTIYDNYIWVHVDLMISLVSVFVYLVFMIKLSPSLALIVVLASLLSFFIPKLAGSKLSKKRKAYSDSQEDFLARVGDLLEARETYNRDSFPRFLKIFKGINGAHEEKSKDLDDYEALTQIISGFSLYFIDIVSFVLGLVLVYLGHIKLSSLIAMLAYVDLVAIPVRDIIFQIITIRSSKDLLEKFDFYKARDEDKEEPKDFENLQVKDLSYKINDFSLEDINMSFDKGKSYVIIGPNGSGKSTIARLVAKRSLPARGQIFLDGRDTVDLDLSSLIFYSSKSTVFSSSLENNIGVDKISPSSLSYEIIKGLERDDLGLGGSKLSMGQKARVGLARALESNREILILDEIFANVDEESERLLTDLLLKSGKTIILVSHNRDKAYLDKFDEVIEINSN